MMTMMTMMMLSNSCFDVSVVVAAVAAGFDVHYCLNYFLTTMPLNCYDYYLYYYLN